jgi:cytochrome c
LPSLALAAPIHDAAKSGDIAALEAALAAGADVNENDGRVGPLHLAVTRGHFEAAKLLLARGADVNGDSAAGAPITIAAFKGNAKMVELLLAHGADPNASFRTETALHSAAERGCLDCVKLLVKAGADVNALNRFREPPIHIAVKNKHAEVAAYLAENGFRKLSPPPPVAPLLAKANVSNGEALFVKTCKNCHDVSPDERMFRGPPLWNIVGRDRGAVAHFHYSDAMKGWEGAWTYDDLNLFLSDPASALPGTDMGSNGFQEPGQRADLIAYLRSLSDNPAPLP